MLEVSNPNYYYPFIISFIIIFAIIESAIYLIKAKAANKEDQCESDKLLMNDENFIKKSIELKKKYMVVYLLSKAAMWAKAPYNFMLFSLYYKFELGEIGLLYLIDACVALVAGPFLGIISDTFGRKFTSSLCCISNITVISFRLSGIVPLAYLAQVFTGAFGGCLSTSFESWLNYEISKLFGDKKQSVDLFRKNIFAKIMFYDSILSICVTTIGTILYVIFKII
jgi:MFS family permease